MINLFWSESHIRPLFFIQQGAAIIKSLPSKTKVKLRWPQSEPAVMDIAIIGVFFSYSLIASSQNVMASQNVCCTNLKLHVSIIFSY